ncbi:MAG: hypothetical protein HZB16_20375 [Armatimonadetes bacterium]|nr:hypothetical protein [Armatimonadota bacterium]
MPEISRRKPRRRDRRGRFLPRTRDEQFAWIEVELGVGEMGSVNVRLLRPDLDSNGRKRAGIAAAAFIAAIAGEEIGWWDFGVAMPLLLATLAIAYVLYGLVSATSFDRISANRYGLSCVRRWSRAEFWPWGDLLEESYHPDGDLLVFRQGDVLLPHGGQSRRVRAAARSIIGQRWRRDRLVPTAEDIAGLPPNSALSAAEPVAGTADTEARALSPAEMPGEDEAPVDA